MKLFWIRSCSLAVCLLVLGAVQAAQPDPANSLASGGTIVYRGKLSGDIEGGRDARAYVGELTVTLDVSPEKVTGQYQLAARTSASRDSMTRRGRLSGTRQDGRCTLSSQGVTFEGTCTESKFEGNATISWTIMGRSQLVGTYAATVTSFVPAAQVAMQSPPTQTPGSIPAAPPQVAAGANRLPKISEVDCFVHRGEFDQTCKYTKKFCGRSPSGPLIEVQINEDERTIAKIEANCRAERSPEAVPGIRGPCNGCNVVEEGLYGPKLVGQTVYERNGERFAKMKVTAVQKMGPGNFALHWLEESTGKTGLNDATVYYSEKSMNQILAYAKKPGFVSEKQCVKVRSGTRTVIKDGGYDQINHSDGRTTFVKLPDREVQEDFTMMDNVCNRGIDVYYECNPGGPRRVQIGANESVKADFFNLLNCTLQK